MSWSGPGDLSPSPETDVKTLKQFWLVLQKESPDVTEAIRLALLHEHRLQEERDKVVLELFKQKDDTIHNLELRNDELRKDLLHSQGQITVLTARNNELVQQLEKSHVSASSAHSQLEEKAKQVENVNQLNRGVIDELTDAKRSLQFKVESLKKEKLALSTTMQSLETEQEDLKEKITLLSASQQQLTERNVALKAEAKSLKSKLHACDGKLQTKSKKLQSLESVHSLCGEQTNKQKEVIVELQRLQNETQNLSASQESSYMQKIDSLQKAFEASKVKLIDSLAAEDELRNVIIEKNKELQTRSQELDDCKIELAGNRSLVDKLRSLEADCQELSEKLREKEESLKSANDKVNAAEVEKEELHARSILEYQQALDGVVREKEVSCEMLQQKIIRAELDVEQCRRELDTASMTVEKLTMRCDILGAENDQLMSRLNTQVKHSNVDEGFCEKASSVSVESEGVLKNSKAVSRDLRLQLDAAQKLAEAKQQELNALKAAHDRRLNRLRHLQSDYRLLKEQANLSESPRKGAKQGKVRKQQSNILHDDVTEAFNELVKLKQENRNFQIENMNLQEECDLLRVKQGADAAALHEISVCLEQTKSEMRKVLMERESIDISEWQSKLDLLKDKLGQKSDIIDGLQEENKQMSEHIERLQSGRKNLRAELTTLHDERTSKRLEVTDLKAAIHSLEVKLSEKHAETATLKDEVAYFLNESLKHDLKEHGDKDSSTSTDAESDESFEKDDDVTEHAVGNPTHDNVPGGTKVTTGQVEIETCTIATPPPKTLQRKSTLSQRHVFRALRLRIKGLRQQVKALAGEKNLVSSQLADLKDEFEKKQNALTSTSQRLTVAKETIRKLGEENKKLSDENDKFSRQVLSDVTKRRLQEEMRLLESKLKSLNEDFLRKSSTVKELKGENEKLVRQHSESCNKISQLQRDVAQKRTLVEEYRTKMSVHGKELSVESAARAELENKVKLLEESLNTSKTTSSSLQRRLEVVSNEKQEHFARYAETKDVIKERDEQITALEKECTSLTSQVKAFEAEVSTLREESASASENFRVQGDKNARLAAKYKLSQETIDEWRQFVNLLCRLLLKRLEQSKRREAPKPLSPVPSPAQAAKMQLVAEKLLNLSESEFRDFISPESKGDGLESIDTLWQGQVDKLSSLHTGFAEPLTNLILTKLGDSFSSVP